MPNFGAMFGGVLYYLYNIVGHDYGFALIIFTIVVKLLLMPLNIKQIKSSMRQQELQPELKKLQERYKNDREKLNEEMVKFFKENNFNPANGCIVTFIQLPILFVLWRVISQPISNMLGGEGFVNAFLSNVTNSVTETDVIFSFTKSIGEKMLSQGVVPPQLIDKVIDLQTGMHFLGIFNLAKIPSYDPTVISSNLSVYLPLLLIPILATLTTFISTKMMMIKSSSVQSGAASGQIDPMKMQQSMMYIGPLMTLIFSFQLPAGLGLYWLAGNIFQIFQQIYINKNVLNKDKVEKEVVKL